MYNTIIVNDKKLSWLVVEKGFKIPSFNYSIESENVKGRAGAVRKSRELNAYTFDLPLVVLNDYVSKDGIKSYEYIADELTKFFDYDEPVKLQFEDKDWYWNAEFAGSIDIHYEAETNMNSFTVKVVLNDPYRYAINGSKNTAISDQISVVNTGTADTPIIIEARALKDSTNFMITKGDEDYFMIGEGEDAFKTVKDTSPTLFTTNFTSLAGWTNQQKGSVVEGGDAGGTVSGNFKSSTTASGTYLIAENFDTSIKGWTGAFIKRSLPRVVDDFVVRIDMRMFARKLGASKGHLHLFDDTGRLLATVGLLDGNAQSQSTRAQFKLYDEQKTTIEIYDDVGTNPKYHAFDSKMINLEIKRKGNQWTFRTWSVYTDDKGKKQLQSRLNRTFNDSGLMYSRKVAGLGLTMMKYDKYNYQPIYMNSLTIKELLPSSNEIPVPIKQGDNIYIDTKDQVVLLNDEPALHLKDFGSNFFNINKGISELIIYPTNTFDTTVKWQDRFI